MTALAAEAAVSTWRNPGGAALVRGDACAIPLGDNTVDLIVTSPPYFALRSYQDAGEHYDGQIGSEATPTAFLEALWAVTAECWRVLKPSGSLFVNLGDKYAGSGGHNNAGIAKPHTGSIAFAGQARNAASRPAARRRSAPDHYTQASDGIRAKSLMGLPWRFAIGCIDGQADPDGKGWILRAEIIWAKPNGLPESVTDRVRRSHEQWFHFTKEPRYFSAVDEIREPQLMTGGQDFRSPNASGNGRTHRSMSADESLYNPLGKLPGSVWTIATQPLVVPDWLGVDHFAAFPTEWPRKLILGWTPSGICTVCGEGRRSTTDKTPMVVRPSARRSSAQESNNANRTSTSGTMVQAPQTVITGEACACPDTSAPTTPAVVLDPFGGTGTTAMVAKALGRYGISLDLSADYLKLARWRVFDSGHGDKAIARTNADAQGDLFASAAQIVEEAGPPAAALDTPEVVSAASGESAPTNQETQHG